MDEKLINRYRYGQKGRFFLSDFFRALDQFYGSFVLFLTNLSKKSNKRDGSLCPILLIILIIDSPGEKSARCT